MDTLTTLVIIVTAWFAFYAVIKLFKVKRDDLEVSPIYVLYKSTRLNGLIARLAAWHPRMWKTLGNVGVAASVGQATYATWLLLNNLLKFVFKPDQASPVQPLIPGVTISASNLPWFMLAAGIVILTHELSHGIQCVLEGIKVKSAAVLVAVITFGGAVEPDDEELNKAPLISKMRVFAAGSIVNLLTALLSLLILNFGRGMPNSLGIFFTWLWFVSFNLAIMNMLPIGPLDGGQMWRTLTEAWPRGKLLQKAATYLFIALIVGNILYSLIMFGLIPL